MTGAQLKNSILQWAIEGKLVPQDPNEESATVLLEKIRAEKLKMVKEGKLKKKDVVDSEIYKEGEQWYERVGKEVKEISEEIPFEIPEGWRWVRLGEIVDFRRSQSVSVVDISNESWVLDLEDIEKDTGVLITKKRKGDFVVKSDKHLFKKGNVLYSKLRPYLNKVIIADEDGFCTSEIVTLDFSYIYNRYAQLYLMSPFFVSYAMSDAYGVKMPRLGSNQGNNALFPIPPQQEQERIVAKIEALQPIIDRYGKAQQELDVLNKTLPERLRKSILQEAIQGKLVPQDQKEGSATELLKSIAQEKQKLLAEGKLKKKDISDSEIYKSDDGKWYERIGKNITCIDEEIPFDIPESWRWVRHNNLFNISGGAQPPKDTFISAEKEGYIRLYQIRDYGKSPQPVFIPMQSASKITKKGDILLARYGASLGKVFYAEDGAYNVALAKVIPLYESTLIYKKYIYLYYHTNLYQAVIKDRSRCAQAGFNKDDLQELLFPLPPMKEQERIVAKIEELFKLLK